ncbi:MAG: hypothetical protein GY835_14940 [bacterium]|nr:hypothetical protein [bacterium]
MKRDGYSILEAVVAMTLFAIGIMALSQSYLGIMRAQGNARSQETATQCAHDRMEEIVNSMKYSNINTTNYPSEDYGEVNGGSDLFDSFSRSVVIADSLNLLGNSVLKEITVEVKWQAAGGERAVSLNSVIANFKDIQL